MHPHIQTSNKPSNKNAPEHSPSPPLIVPAATPHIYTQTIQIQTKPHLSTPLLFLLLFLLLL